MWTHFSNRIHKTKLFLRAEILRTTFFITKRLRETIDGSALVGGMDKLVTKARTIRTLFSCSDTNGNKIVGFT